MGGPLVKGVFGMDMKTAFSLEGKTALVTGGAYGIGFAIAEALASAGAKIAFTCRSQTNLDKALATSPPPRPPLSGSGRPTAAAIPLTSSSSPRPRRAAGAIRRT